MAKHKLALIGKNISHSKSPEIYNQLLNNQVEYTLLDCATADEIPSLDELMRQFDGVSITSPYKESLINSVGLNDVASKLRAINCLYFENGKVFGANTDYLAIVDLVAENFMKYKIDSIIILGDGVMSRVAEAALKTFNKEPLIFSRKLTTNFKHLNLTDYTNQEKVLVINTCAREYVYEGLVSKDIIFWDFNYSFQPHVERLSSKCVYQDGLKMLELQAQYALRFWSIKKKI